MTFFGRRNPSFHLISEQRLEPAPAFSALLPQPPLGHPRRVLGERGGSERSPFCCEIGPSFPPSSSSFSPPSPLFVSPSLSFFPLVPARKGMKWHPGASSSARAVTCDGGSLLPPARGGAGRSKVRASYRLSNSRSKAEQSNAPIDCGFSRPDGGNRYLSQSPKTEDL